MTDEELNKTLKILEPHIREYLYDQNKCSDGEWLYYRSKILSREQFIVLYTSIQILKKETKEVE
jgi:hypothetical protein